MWCVKCDHDVVECDCPDIEQRLRSLYETDMGLAAAQNIQARKALWDSETLEKDAS